MKEYREELEFILKKLESDLNEEINRDNFNIFKIREFDEKIKVTKEELESIKGKE